MKLGLRGKFLSTTIALILLGTLMSAGISFFLAQRMLQQIIEKQLQQQSAATMEYISSFIENRRQDVILWSQQSIFVQTVVLSIDPELKGAGAGSEADSGGSGFFVREANETLKSYKKAHPYFEEIAIANSSGDVLTSSQVNVGAALATGKIIKDKSFFQKAFAGAVVVSEVAVSQSGGNPVLTIAAPVKKADGVSGGVLYGIVNLTYFTEKFIEPIKIGASGYVFLFNSDGMV
ncbi:MAG: cache domain-containing protein, partial [Proteobacteria bacterium]|nr:cache domain-containing protein [Pseudomonadota bacterium]